MIKEISQCEYQVKPVALPTTVVENLHAVSHMKCLCDSRQTLQHENQWHGANPHCIWTINIFYERQQITYQDFKRIIRTNRNSIVYGPCNSRITGHVGRKLKAVVGHLAASSEIDKEEWIWLAKLCRWFRSFLSALQFIMPVSRTKY